MISHISKPEKEGKWRLSDGACKADKSLPIILTFKEVSRLPTQNISTMFFGERSS